MNNQIELQEKPEIENFVEFLNDSLNSREFYDTKLARAKEILEEILMITSGAFERTDNYHDWSHELFIELFSILSIRHKNFHIPDFCDELMTFVFSRTIASSDLEFDWRKKIYQKANPETFNYVEV